MKLIAAILLIGTGMYLAGWYLIMDTSAKVAAHNAAYYDSLLKIAGGN